MAAAFGCRSGPLDAVSSRMTVIRTENSKRAIGHLCTALREIGVFLLVFGPLELLVRGGGLFYPTVTVAVSVLVFAIGVAWEWNYDPK